MAAGGLSSPLPAEDDFEMCLYLRDFWRVMCKPIIKKKA
jgi:hypothetical protein